MIPRPLLLCALVAALPLAACGEYRGLETVHQPVVAQTDYALDLLAGPDGLGGGEAERLRGWLDVLAPSAGAMIAIDDPASSPVARAQIAALASARGLRLASGATSHGDTPPPGTLRVVVTRAVASVPSCQAPGAAATLVNFDAHTSGAFGCAINGTLAAMIADPNDLIRGKSDDGVGAAVTGAKAIGVWRKAAPTGGGGTVVKSESTGGR